MQDGYVTYVASYIVTILSCWLCSFLHYSRTGGWDVTGVTTVNSNDTFITCDSTHLTSFAVLVDVSGQSTRVMIM